MMGMRLVDLFAGCGGLSLGMEKAGFNIVAAYENWDAAADIYRQNFNHPMYEVDLSDTDYSIKHIEKFRPDIIVGGPPCQDFSSAGKRMKIGSRGNLTISYAEIISEIRPRWFLMENVERIKKLEVFEKAKKILKEAGYGLSETVLDASLCQVPQKRKRMFLIGNLNSSDGFIENELNKNLSETRLSVRQYMGEKLETEFYYRHARSYARRGIFSIDEPSPTVRGVNRPIPPSYIFHPGDAVKDFSKVRPLTTLERARIQTFPANFNWGNYSKTTLEQIIGNAVPVNLGKYVGECILKYEKTQQSSIKKNDTHQDSTIHYDLTASV